MRSQPGSVSRSIGFATVVFIIGALLLILQIFTDAIPKHANDTSWPLHARFHLGTGMLRQAGLALVTIMVTLWPFRRERQPWAWWALLIFLIFGWGATYPSYWYYHNGPGGTASWVEIGVVFVLMVIALAATWKPIFRQQP